MKQAQSRSLLRLRVCRRGDESGAAIVEFSLVVGLFVFLLYGIIAFGMAIGVKQNVTHAAFAGARAAVGLTGAPAQTAARNMAQQDLSEYPSAAYQIRGADLNPDPDVENWDPNPTIANCTNGPGQCITVTVIYDYSGYPVVPEAPGLGVVLPGEFHSQSIVQIA